MITVSVAKDFTRYPAGRYKRNGETSGEAFRERFLEDPIRKGETVLVDFDGTVGYGSSFLEEAFGGVVRTLRLPADFVIKHLSFKSSDPSIPEEVVEYIEDAGRKLG
ncbi:DUF4325 domain-containing protein [Variovorax atrisoli]|uniref:STAS-like domain-containing protein n=1 Tax=Variovorax atrisoli TaxID=3394203 RepID=UPI000F7E2B17|nr:STAS-like domain-containing protein [Variovorax sp. 369]RTD94420.1 DUF4325 domain-containing protein [Variovorax sp. 369]